MMLRVFIVAVLLVASLADQHQHDNSSEDDQDDDFYHDVILDHYGCCSVEDSTCGTVSGGHRSPKAS